MALFRCTNDNQHDGKQGYRKGVVYDFPSNPNTDLFVAIAASDADSIKVEDAGLPSWLDIEGDYHVPVDLQFDRAVTLSGGLSMGITSVTGDTTIRADDGIGVIDVTTGESDVNIYLPSASSSVGRMLYISKIDSGGGDVVVTASGSDTIIGESTLRISFQHSNAQLQAQATSWGIR